MAGLEPPPGSQSLDFPFGTWIEKRFSIVEKAGEGDMGVVFRAWDDLMKEHVALKFARTEPDADGLERLRQEIRIGRLIGHPRILCAREAFKHEDRVTFVYMDYVEGDDLESLLVRFRRLAPEAVIPIAIELAALLEHLHAGGIVHRDLKPANVMLGTDGHVRIIDLGVAVFADLAREELVGTIHYMAPEQVRTDPAKPPVDIYAFGLLMYEALTGRQCLKGADLREIAECQQVAFTRPPEIEPAIDRIVLECLELDPERRPTATQLRKEWECLC